MKSVRHVLIIALWWSSIAAPAATSEAQSSDVTSKESRYVPEFLSTHPVLISAAALAVIAYLARTYCPVFKKKQEKRQRIIGLELE